MQPYLRDNIPFTTMAREGRKAGIERMRGIISYSYLRAACNQNFKPFNAFEESGLWLPLFISGSGLAELIYNTPLPNCII